MGLHPTSKQNSNATSNKQPPQVLPAGRSLAMPNFVRQSFGDLSIATPTERITGHKIIASIAFYRMTAT